MSHLSLASRRVPSGIIRRKQYYGNHATNQIDEARLVYCQLQKNGSISLRRQTVCANQ